LNSIIGPEATEKNPFKLEEDTVSPKATDIIPEEALLLEKAQIKEVKGVANQEVKEEIKELGIDNKK
jgi:hypothetical protein